MQLVCRVMRETLISGIKETMAEWEAALADGAGESSLRFIFNAQCNLMAIEALKQAEAEL